MPCRASASPATATGLPAQGGVVETGHRGVKVVQITVQYHAFHFHHESNKCSFSHCTPAAPKSPQERNGNFSACPGDAFSIPQRGERILSIHAQESGGASRRRRRRTAGWRRKKSPPVHPHAKPAGCSVLAESVPMLIARRLHAPAPPRRSPHRFPESFVPPTGVRTAGDLRPPASRPRRSRPENRFFARKHGNSRKKYMKTQKKHWKIENK